MSENNKTAPKTESRTRANSTVAKPRAHPRTTTNTTAREDFRRTREGVTRDGNTIAREGGTRDGNTIAREGVTRERESVTFSREEYFARTRDYEHRTYSSDEPRSYPLMAYQEEVDLFVKLEMENRFDWQGATLHPRKIMFAGDEVPLAWKELSVQQCRGNIKEKDKKKDKK